MEKSLKTKYDEPKLEVMAFINSDIITTSNVDDGVGNVGSDGNIDDGGWTGGSAKW